MNNTPKIAVIGSGISGLVAAYALQANANVTLFESEPRLGGHANTHILSQGPDQGLGIDTGFIVCNPLNYPLFYRLLSHLGITPHQSDMSFSFTKWNSDTYPFVSYSSDFPKGVFAKPGSWKSPNHLGMLVEMFRFNRQTVKDYKNKKLIDLTLSEFLKNNHYSTYFGHHYVIPMASAIWSTTHTDMENFPMENFVRFWINHGLLQVFNRPVWTTIPGGSRTYVSALEAKLTATIIPSTPILSVEERSEDIVVTTASEETHSFNAVVIATHADQAFRLLKNPAPIQSELLSPWTYSKNEVILHTDISQMPPYQNAWASWNVLHYPKTQPNTPLTLTYWMNRLQTLSTKHPYLVTLNPQNPIDSNKIIQKYLYTHPIFSTHTMSLQPRLPKLNQTSRIVFCGSYFGFGFHEDGLRSGLDAAMVLGGKCPF